MKRIFCITVFLLIQLSCKEEVHREVLFTYEDSTPKIIAEYTDHQKSLNVYKRIQFYPNGIISGEGLMINEKQNGKWKYFDENGNLIAENILKDNKSIDSITCWYPTGELSRKMIDLKDSSNKWSSKDFYKNGQIKISTYLLNNEIPDSIFTEFHSNGTIKRQGELNKGKMINKWTEYDSTGVVINEIFESGKANLIFGSD